MGSFVPLGAAFTVAGLLLAVRTWVFLRGATTVQGRVVELAPSSGENGTVYSPVVEYATPAGTHRVTSDSRSSHPRAKVGQPMSVKYDPDRPDRGKIARPLDLWGLAGLFGFLGLTFVVVGLA